MLKSIVNEDLVKDFSDVAQLLLLFLISIVNIKKAVNSALKNHAEHSV